MKTIFLGMFALITIATLAQAKIESDLIVKCSEQIGGYAGMPACAGVKTDKDVEMVVKCAKQIGGYAGMPACRIVR